MRRGSLIDSSRGGLLKDRAVQASVDAGPPKPWRDLSDHEQQIWDLITDTKANSEWTGIDIYLAVEVCQCLVKIATFNQILDDCLYLQFAGTANERPHPYINVVTRMWDRVLRIQTKLGIALTTEVVGAEEKMGTRLAERAANEFNQTVESDDLIPRPQPTSIAPPTKPHGRTGFNPAMFRRDAN
jgi:hypothetical protein